MKNSLTLEKIEQRKNTNKKILKFGCLPIFILLLIIGNLNKTEDKTSKIKKINMDSIISKVKSNKDFDIKDVYYNTKDSSFNIAITNKNNMIKEGTFSAIYFNNEYKLDSINEIEGVYLYEFKKGKSFIKNDYKEYLACSSKNLAKRIEKFKRSGYEYNIKSYLEKNVNDPTDLEILNKWVLNENSDGTFSVKVTFRAKNAFGALMIHTMNCDMDMDGNGKNIVFDK